MNLKGVARVIALILAVPIASGCGTLVNGSTQMVDVTSVPSGATATVLPAGHSVITPSQVELKRKSSHTILIEKEGYEPISETVSRRLSGWLWLNLVLLGPLGLGNMILDLFTGGAYALKPKTVAGTLVLIAPEISQESPERPSEGPATERKLR